MACYGSCITVLTWGMVACLGKSRNLDDDVDLTLYGAVAAGLGNSMFNPLKLLSIPRRLVL